VVLAAFIAKSPGLVPPMLAVSVIATDCLFVTVTFCGALVVPTATVPKERLVGEMATAFIPVPLRLTVCGLPAALSLIASTPVRVPTTVGVKVTEIEQLRPAARLAPQLLVCEKSPVVAMLAIMSDAFPVLLSLTDFAELVVLTA